MRTETMRSCREVARLVSQSLDEKLPWWQRLLLWFHLAMCRLCRKTRHDLLFLRRETQWHAEQFGEDPIDDSVQLSPAARERIQKLLDGESR